MESVVDGIPELRDQHEVGDEWKLLLAPLTNSFTLRVSEAPEALYVEPDVNQKRQLAISDLANFRIYRRNGARSIFSCPKSAKDP